MLCEIWKFCYVPLFGSLRYVGHCWIYSTGFDDDKMLVNLFVSHAYLMLIEVFIVDKSKIQKN